MQQFSKVRCDGVQNKKPENLHDDAWKTHHVCDAEKNSSHPG